MVKVQGPDQLMQSMLTSNVNGGRSSGGGSVMMVSVPAPSRPAPRLSPIQTFMALGAVGSLAYLTWKARR